MMYGFVVAAWLILPISDGQKAIPFASMAYCESARIEISKDLNPMTARYFKCVPTGKPR